MILVARQPDPWKGQLNDYCYNCATRRCDAFPGPHDRKMYDYVPKFLVSLEDEVTEILDEVSATVRWSDNDIFDAFHLLAWSEYDVALLIAIMEEEKYDK